jgi:hypothetical protein
MYQVFNILDKYNVMIKLKNIDYRYEKSSVMEKFLWYGVVINELW